VFNINHKIDLDDIIIRPPKSSDLFFLRNLWENPQVMSYVGFPKGLKQSDEKIKNWIQNWQKGGLHLIIEDKKEIKPIGEIGYRLEEKRLNNHKRKFAVLDIKMTPNYWGKGIGFRTLDALIKKLDQNSNFDYYELTPNVENKRAMNLYYKLGFKKSGKPEVWKSPQGITIVCQLMIKKAKKHK